MNDWEVKNGLYYDRAGVSISRLEWMDKFSNKEYMSVCSTFVGSIYISTTWLGINHGLGFDGPPLIFETMVFGYSDEEDFMKRHVNEESARLYHYKAVQHLIDIQALTPPSRFRRLVDCFRRLIPSGRMRYNDVAIPYESNKNPQDSD